MSCIVKPRKFGRRKNRQYGRGKPYVKNGKIYFGGKVYKGGTIPLFSILGNLAKGLLGIQNKMRQKDNYFMIKMNTPKRVTLPNGQTFIVLYKQGLF